MNEAPTRALIIGVGNPYRGDDGAGIAIARQIAKEAPRGIKVLEESGEGTALVDAWQAASFVVVVDAIQSGAPPGSILRFEAREEHLAGELHRSTHAFGVSGAIELARALNELPARLIVYGIEGQRFAPCEKLSEEVARAVPLAAARILSETESQLTHETEPLEERVSEAVHAFV